MKQIIDKLDFLIIKNFFSRKDNSERMRKHATLLEEIFVKYTSNKELLPKIVKLFINIKNNKKKPTQLKWSINFNKCPINKDTCNTKACKNILT